MAARCADAPISPHIFCLVHLLTTLQRIFAVLLRRGRLPISGLQQHTKLNPRQLRHGLVVLIQQNLLYHNTENDTGVTYYEANEDAAYFLLRSGRILEIIQNRYGNDAKDVVQNLLLLGHAKVADLAEAYKSKAKLTNGTANGQVNGNSNSVNLDGILKRLLDDGFVEPLVKSMFKSPADIFSETEREMIRAGGDSTGPPKAGKAADELRLQVLRSMERAREQRSWRSGNLKRYNTGIVPASEKRRKLANGRAAATGPDVFEDDVLLDRDLVVRANFERCTVALRTDALAAAAENEFGTIPSQVYGTLLRTLEDKVPRCKQIDELKEDEDASTNSVTVSQLATVLDSNINVSQGIGIVPPEWAKLKPGDMPSQFNGKRKRGYESPADSEDEGEGVRDMDSKQSRMTRLKDHLGLVSIDRQDLLKRLSNDGLGEFTVPFEQATAFLKETELDTYIAATFGKQGLRLSHVLRKYGKLDEKQIHKIALMKQGEVRKTLIRMQMAGFADIQEVPKDAMRTPNRTIFLWWFDTERVQVHVLDNICKTICRCLEVLEAERYKARDIIAMANRSDVVANEIEVLTPEHLKELTAFRVKEQHLTAQINRLDQLVGIYKDF